MVKSKDVNYQEAGAVQNQTPKISPLIKLGVPNPAKSELLGGNILAASANKANNDDFDMNYQQDEAMLIPVHDDVS
jgi:hypothetical protein